MSPGGKNRKAKQMKLRCEVGVVVRSCRMDLASFVSGAAAQVDRADLQLELETTTRTVEKLKGGGEVEVGDDE